MAPSADSPSKRRRVEEENSYYDYENEEEDDKPAYVPLKQRRLQQLQSIKNKSNGIPSLSSTTSTNKDDYDEEEEEKEDRGVEQSKHSLLSEARELREKQAKENKSLAEKEAEEEQKILEAHAARRKLASDMELAKGISYTDPIKTSWTPPKFVRDRSQEENEKLREKNHILTDGTDVPPLITNFRVSIDWEWSRQLVVLLRSIQKRELERCT